MRWLPLLVLFAGCDEGEWGVDLPELDGAQEKARDECTVRFTVLQKDAYAETAGRTSDLWPPHTTTELNVTCTRSDGSTDKFGDFQANHGTAPGDTDANGDVLLERAGGSSVTTTRKKAEALLEAYGACECETEFLTMDAIDDAVVESVVADLAGYLEAHLDCGGDPPIPQLVQALLAGDVEVVAAALPECSWRGQNDLAEGLDEALLQAVGGSLDAYHVCNNDATIQAELWSQFEADGTVGTCGTLSDACRGPRWLYVY